MASHESQLRARFDALSGPPDDSDWNEVAMRARAFRPKRSSRLRIVAPLTVFVGAVILVAPALALRDAFLGLFSGESAPARIERIFSELDEGAPSNLATRVIANDAHKLIEVQLSNGRTATLWVAPTESGGWCYYLERVGGPATGGPGCNAPIPTSSPVLATILGPAENSLGPVLAFGAVREDVRSLALELSDGTAEEIDLVKGFFLTELPSGKTRRAVALVGRTASGSTLPKVTLSAGFGISGR